MIEQEWHYRFDRKGLKVKAIGLPLYNQTFNGSVAEWLNAPVLKTGEDESPP